jgi:hypothetical protein
VATRLPEKMQFGRIRLIVPAPEALFPGNSKSCVLLSFRLRRFRITNISGDRYVRQCTIPSSIDTHVCSDTSPEQDRHDAREKDSYPEARTNV